MRKASVPAFLLLVASAVLGATVFHEPLANAARLAQTVVISNTPEQAVPVREQNLDHGSVRVREQGTVSVRALVPAEPWHSAFDIPVPNTRLLFSEPSSSAINITSLTVSDVGVGGEPAGVTAALYTAAVPDSAASCYGASFTHLLWHSATFTAPLAVAFPTPLVVADASGQRVCVQLAVGGTSTDRVAFSASGFFGGQ